MATGWWYIRPVAIVLMGGSAAARNRRRSSGRHYEAWSRRNPHRTCTRRNRSALPSRAAANPCRNIRSSVEVAAPWSSHPVISGSSQIGRVIRMTNFPRFGPSPLAPQAGRGDPIPVPAQRANSFSGSLALSFSRSSTIDERTCATLWCGISTLLTMSDRLLRSRSTAFST